MRYSRMGRYLGSDILHGFDSYKYSSLDTSPFSNYVMHPFWNSFVKLIPMSVAANTLTFVGFLLLPLSFTVLSYYDFDFRDNHAIPLWVWCMCAFNNFMSHTLDGIDGKQARRTGTSSILGELFDHGLDAWSTSFFAIAIYDIFGQGIWGAPPLRFLLVLMALQCTFAFSHWEKYNTGVLYLPWGYDVALVGMTAVFLATFFGGIEFWEQYVPYSGDRLTIANFLEISLYVTNYLMSVPVCIFNVLLANSRGTGRNLSLFESLRPLMPIAILFPLIYTWAAYSPNDIVANHARCYYTLSGILFANITSRMIVNQMSHTRAQAFNWLLLPLIVIAPMCVIYNLHEYETYLLYTYTAVTLLAHIDYGQGVVHEIADYLNIYVFSVQKPPSKTK